MKNSFLAKIRVKMEDLQKFQKDINNVFKAAASTVGKGIKTAFNGVKNILGAGGLITALNALLRPLERLNTTLQSFLSESEDYLNQSTFYGSSIREYLALTEAGAKSSLDKQTINQLLVYTMKRLGEANAGNQNVLSQYKGQTNVVKVLANVLDQLGKMGPTPERAQILSNLFDTRFSARLAKVISNGSFINITKDIASTTTFENALANINEAIGLSDLADNEASTTNLLRLAGYKVNANMVKEMEASRRRANANTAGLMLGYSTFAQADEIMQNATNEIIKWLASNSGRLTPALDALASFSSEGLPKALKIMDWVATTAIQGYNDIVRFFREFDIKEFTRVYLNALNPLKWF